MEGGTPEGIFLNEQQTVFPNTYRKVMTLDPIVCIGGHHEIIGGGGGGWSFSLVILFISQGRLKYYFFSPQDRLEISISISILYLFNLLCG